MQKNSFFKLAGIGALLTACATGEPLAEGEKSILIGIPRSADCRMDGDNLKVTTDQNIMGKGITARGDIDQSVLICTNAEGQTLMTTDHRSILKRAPSANAVLYSVKPGTNKVSGGQYINGRKYEFWTEFTFVPAG